MRLERLPFTRALLAYIGFIVLLDLYLNHYLWFSSRPVAHTDGRIAIVADPQIEGLGREIRQGFYGWLNNRLNDAVYRHMFRNIAQAWTPTHVFVLGDIFSNQMIGDLEFEQRVTRYRHQMAPATEQQIPVYNIVGNHDIGYGDESSQYQIDRFERAFGPTNDVLVLSGHVICILNSLMLDRARNKVAVRRTYDHIRECKQQAEERRMPLILMTHVPLHKPEGTCVDPPLIRWTWDGYVIEQTMLSPNVSNMLLDQLDPVFIFTGHDHEGCEYVHRGRTKEYTVRSMMADFSSNALLFQWRSAGELVPVDGMPGRRARYEYFVQQRTLLYTKMITVVIVLHCVALVLVPVWLLRACWMPRLSRIIKIRIE